MRFLIPPVSNHVLFEATLDPIAYEIQLLSKKDLDPSVAKIADAFDTQIKGGATLDPIAYQTKMLSKDLGLSEAKIADAFGKQVEVAVGEPYCRNLISEFNEKKEEMPKEISSQLDDFDFHFVSLSCSFRPDPGCRIISARFGVELSATSKSGRALKKKPIAWNIYPEKISSQTTYKREVHYTPGIGFTLGPVTAGLKMDMMKGEEFVFYEPEIFAYGLKRPVVSWDFRRTKSKEIFGNQSLFLVVRTPKQSKINGRFLLGAQSECNSKKWLIMRHGKKEGEPVEVEYPLCLN